MIGGIQEPERMVLDELNRILGEGTYAISYAHDSAGLRTIVRTHDRPAREWSTQFGPSLAPEQSAAVWQEFLQRIARSEGKLEAAPGGGGSAEESRAETIPDEEQAPSPVPSDEAPKPEVAPAQEAQPHGTTVVSTEEHAHRNR